MMRALVMVLMLLVGCAGQHSQSGNVDQTRYQQLQDELVARLKDENEQLRQRLKTLTDADWAAKKAWQQLTSCEDRFKTLVTEVCDEEGTAPDCFDALIGEHFTW